MPGSSDKPVTFTKGSARYIGRTLKEFRGRGRGEAPPPRRPRRGEGGGGGTGNELFLGYTTETIAAGTGDFDDRTPGTGDGTVFLGTGEGTDWENYSLVEISTNTICVVTEIDGHNVIIAAFC